MRETSPLSAAAPICSKSAGGALFTLLCMCVKRGAGRKEGQREGGSGEMEGQGWKRERGGGLLVISPEGDNGRGAHCNGCHVVPSLHN